MIPPFSFASAEQILFGAGVADRLPELARRWGQRALVICGRRPERHAERLDRLRDAGLSLCVLSVTGEPTTTDAERATASGRAHQADLVIGLGGGSALDLAKATAALLACGGDPLNFLEVVGQGRPLEQPPLPWIAVPTTAGTGAEVTKNAVLASPTHGVKVSLRSDLLLPKAALIDPLLTVSVPKDITATTGFDALTQVIEPFVSGQANPLTDALCREGIQRGGRSLVAAVVDGANVEAREDLALASLFGGLALANARLGAVHGFAGPLGGMYDAPHGALCAALLPGALQVNQAALSARAPESPALARINEVAQLLIGDPGANAHDGIEHLRAMARRTGIQGLSTFGITRGQFPRIIPKARQASSMKGNPIELTDDELTELLALSL